MSEAVALRDVLHACGDAGSQLYNAGIRVSDRLNTSSYRTQLFRADAGSVGVRLDQRFRDLGDVTLEYYAVVQAASESQWRAIAAIVRAGQPAWWEWSSEAADTTADLCHAVAAAVRAIEATVISDDVLRAVFPDRPLVAAAPEKDKRFDGPAQPVAGVPLVGLRAVCESLAHANGQLLAAGAALADRYNVARPEPYQSAWEYGYETRLTHVYLDLNDADLLTQFELDFEKDTGTWTARAGIGFEWPLKYGATDSDYNWRHERRRLTTFAEVADAARRVADELLAEAKRIGLVPPAHLPRR